MMYNEHMQNVLEQHTEFLAAFKKELWPLYEEYGFTFGEAILAYQLNAFNNDVYNDFRVIKKALQTPKEDWEK